MFLVPVHPRGVDLEVKKDQTQLPSHTYSGPEVIRDDTDVGPTPQRSTLQLVPTRWLGFQPDLLPVGHMYVHTCVCGDVGLWVYRVRHRNPSFNWSHQGLFHGVGPAPRDTSSKLPVEGPEVSDLMKKTVNV